MKNHVLLLLTACWLAAFVAMLATLLLEQATNQRNLHQFKQGVSK